MTAHSKSFSTNPQGFDKRTSEYGAEEVYAKLEKMITAYNAAHVIGFRGNRPGKGPLKFDDRARH
jgi:hypothetical protein